MRPTARDSRGALLLAVLALLPAIGSWFWFRGDPEFRLAMAPVARVRAWNVAAAGSDGVLWLDARGAEQFAAGHVPGAINVGGMTPDDATVAIAAAWRPGLRPVAYGDPRDTAGARRTAARLSRDMGIGAVGVLAGDWRRVNKPSTRETRP